MSPEHRKLDLEQLQTPEGREAALRLNRNLAKSDLRQHRMWEVLKEYSFFERGWQLDLAEAAIVYALAALAGHERCADCESNYFAFIDIMYSCTNDAETTYSESEREQIEVAAVAVQQHLTPVVGEVLLESQRSLAELKEDHPLRLTAELLHRIRTTYIEVAGQGNLHRLIPCCLMLAIELEANSLGVGTVNQFASALRDVATACTATTKCVHQGVKDGQIVVKDGRFERLS